MLTRARLSFFPPTRYPEPMPRNPRKRRELSKDELDKLFTLSQRRVPMDLIASVLGLSTTWLEELVKKDGAIRNALESGRAAASIKTRGLAFEVACGRPAKYDAKGNLIEAEIRPDLKMLRFWLQTQEGFSATERVELMGPGGGPIETVEVDQATRRSEIERLRKLRDTCGDD
jgi:hypothetical protein